jgi:hypothetical protein
LGEKWIIKHAVQKTKRASKGPAIATHGVQCTGAPWPLQACNELRPAPPQRIAIGASLM